jgi:hypothetical protein
MKERHLRMSESGQGTGIRAQTDVPLKSLNKILRRTEAPFARFVRDRSQRFGMRVFAGPSSCLAKSIFFLEATNLFKKQ